ncbi:MAG: phosphonate ABC transporter, permease protein PhnE [Acidimicrobiia bacterium]|nr:phosphonate ABC transporter, permease protein PhnE [Acidimicrobiia bacterium]
MTTNPSVGRPPPPSHTKRNLALLGVGVLVVLAFFTVDVEIDRLADLPSGLGLIFYNMFVEEGLDWGSLPDGLLLMVESIQIAWLGTLIGAVLSLPLAFLGAHNITSGGISNVVRQILNAIRAVPEIILAAIVFIPMVGLGPYAGTLAIGIHSIGTLGKLSAEVIEGVDPGPVEAARAAGAGALQVQRWGVLPQVMPEIVAFWLYRFEINIRAAAILGVVGAGGIGEALQQALVFGRYPRAGMLILVVIVVTILVDGVSGAARRRIIEGSGARRFSGEPIEEPDLVAAGAV